MLRLSVPSKLYRHDLIRIDWFRQDEAQAYSGGLCRRLQIQDNYASFSQYSRLNPKELGLKGKSKDSPSLPQQSMGLYKLDTRGTASAALLMPSFFSMLGFFLRLSQSQPCPTIKRLCLHCCWLSIVNGRLNQICQHLHGFSFGNLAERCGDFFELFCGDLFADALVFTDARDHQCHDCADKRDTATTIACILSMLESIASNMIMLLYVR